MADAKAGKDQPKDPGEAAQAVLADVRSAVKGNGLKPDSVTLEKLDAQTAEFTAATLLELNADTSETTQPGRASAKKTFPDKHSARSQMMADTDAVSEDPAISGKIRDLILKRDDKGFGLQNAKIPVPFMGGEYAAIMNCQPCRASGKIQCRNCRAEGYEECKHCRGRGEIQCTHCRGSGQLQTQNGMQSCTYCQGRQKMRCNYCKGERRTPCNFCKTKGWEQCKECQGKGAVSTLIKVSYQAIARFQYELKNLPQNIVSILKSEEKNIAKHALFKVKTTDRKDREEGEDAKSPEGLGVHYQCQLPYANAAIKIKSEEIPLLLFGKTYEPANVPDFLDKILAPGLKALGNAAQEGGLESVQRNLKQAMRYKTIYTGVMASAAKGETKGAQILMSRHPIGLSQEKARQIVTHAGQALDRLGKKDLQKWMGIAVGVGAGVAALYFVTPVKGMANEAAGGGQLAIIMDCLALAVAGGCGLILFRHKRAGIRTGILQNLKNRKK